MKLKITPENNKLFNQKPSIIIGIFGIYSYSVSQFFTESNALLISVIIFLNVVGVITAKWSLTKKNLVVVIATSMVLIVQSVILSVLYSSIYNKASIRQSDLIGSWELVESFSMISNEMVLPETDRINCLKFYEKHVEINLTSDSLVSNFLFELDDNYIDLIAENDTILSFKVLKENSNTLTVLYNSSELIFKRIEE